MQTQGQTQGDLRDDLPMPIPAAGDVVIEVAAAGVNKTDINTRLAWYSKDDGDAADASWSPAPRWGGAAAAQLLRARGASVLAITSPSKQDSLLDLGADRVLFRDDLLVDTLGQNSMDVVIDLVVGDTWPALLDVLRPGGRYAVSGAIGGPIVELDIRTLSLKDLSFLGARFSNPRCLAIWLN